MQQRELSAILANEQTKAALEETLSGQQAELATAKAVIEGTTTNGKAKADKFEIPTVIPSHTAPKFVGVD